MQINVLGEIFRLCGLFVWDKDFIFVVLLYFIVLLNSVEVTTQEEVSVIGLLGKPSQKPVFFLIILFFDCSQVQIKTYHPIVIILRTSPPVLVLPHSSIPYIS